MRGIVNNVQIEYIYFLLLEFLNKIDLNIHSYLLRDFTNFFFAEKSCFLLIFFSFVPFREMVKWYNGKMVQMVK